MLTITQSPLPSANTAYGHLTLMIITNIVAEVKK